MPTPDLPLERFAELSAELDAGVSREQMLEKAGLTAEAWAGAQEHWLGKIAAEATRKRFDLTTRYTKAFSARRKALAEAAKGGVGPLAAPAPIEPARTGLRGGPSEPPPPLEAPRFTPPPPAEPAGSPPAFVAPPPFVEPERAPSEPRAAPSEPPPLFAPSPFGARAPDAPPRRAATSELPAMDPGAADLGQTVAAVSPFAIAASLPFRSGGTKPGSTPPAGPPAGLPFRASGEAEAAAGGLPFRAAAAEPEGAPAAVPFRGAAPAPVEPPPRPPPRRGKTEQFSLEDVLVEPLPFKPAEASPPLRATSPVPAAAQGGLPFQAAPAARGSAPGAGAPPPRAPSSPPAAAAPSATPPASAEPAPVARLPLARFAQMTAESQLWPTALAAIRARYGLDEAAYSAENDAWQRLFLRDAALYARYGQLLSHYRDWLAKSAR